MKREILASALFFFVAGGASAETLDEFFQKNPEIQSNTDARLAVKSKAAMLAHQEAFDSGSERISDAAQLLIRKNGGEYARSAIKLLVRTCNNQTMETNMLDSETCKYLQDRLPTIK